MNVNIVHFGKPDMLKLYVSRLLNFMLWHRCGSSLG